MITNQFYIKVTNLHWIKNFDDEDDLCAHGNVIVKIGDEIICDENSLDFTIFATALYLLRSLSKNYKKGDYDSQFLPCCGFFTYFDENGSPMISGCPNGIDWTIEHINNHQIKHTSENGTEAIINIEDYKIMVYEFVDKIEEFYAISKPKRIPEDEFDRGSYLEIWEEWKKLRYT
ncbi:hypothetical protein H1R17_00500 [Flavobacterium sp. xlx-214]|uniref:hypothetical protein n=1 Tax=unclassified Flavobacterium TaxID=196869 RepID=UPI0013D1CDB9|nr:MULTISPECIES: hypothetical protein [unclassified Flavobacterium]MBA5791169.1 hypothetical protein [Flavobacterium sp. xlx-221]QMI83661.1 hypothetical protein H1R17_00500 [Flavobacterium sp. xlx-214]